MTADERTATAQVLAATPRPTVDDDHLAGPHPHRTRGGLTGVCRYSATAADLRQSHGPAQVGAFSYQLVDWGGSSPAGTADPYRYDVMFPAADHIDADQTYTVDASKLTTVHNTIDSDPGNTAPSGPVHDGPSVPTLGGFGTGYVIPTRST